jgi:hypothetical protein
LRVYEYFQNASHYSIAVPHANSEFNFMNVNLVAPVRCEYILDRQPKGGINVEHRPCGVAPLKEGTIMTKSLLTGIAVCAALAVFAGNANAYRAPIHTTRTAQSMSSLTAKGGPLHDCVHVTFPQCGPHEPEPND